MIPISKNFSDIFCRNMYIDTLSLKYSADRNNQLCSAHTGLITTVFPIRPLFRDLDRSVPHIRIPVKYDTCYINKKITTSIVLLDDFRVIGNEIKNESIIHWIQKNQDLLYQYWCEKISFYVLMMRIHS